MIKTIREWKMYKESILIPRNLQGRDEKINQKWYRLFTTQEVIDGDIEIKMNLNIDPSKIKTKKINGHVRLRNITKIPKFFKDIEINGWFDCGYNNLTTLEGCPQIINRSLRCSHNKINTFEGFPKEVGNYIRMVRNSKKFKEEDIRKHCKVKNGIVLSDK